MVLSASTGIILAGLLLIVGLVITKHTEWLGLAAPALVFALLSGHNSILNGIQMPLANDPWWRSIRESNHGRGI